MYFWKEPYCFSSLRNSPALWIVARIFFSFLTIPSSCISVFTFFSEKRATFAGAKAVKPLRKLGHLFSTTFQLSPAVKTVLVIRSKYSVSFLGLVAFQSGDMECRSASRYLWAPPREGCRLL